MRSINTFLATAVALPSTTQVADLSYNGLATTPQMDWVGAISRSRHFTRLTIFPFRIIGTPSRVTVSEESLLGTEQKIIDWGLRDLVYKCVLVDD
jgi:hypothetical protein